MHACSQYKHTGSLPNLPTIKDKRDDKASKYINDGSTQIVAANNSLLLAELVVQKYSINFTDKNIKQQIQDQKGKNISSMCLVC
jgi:hypothetical protein